MDYLNLNDIISRIEKEGDYEKKFIKYFESLNLNNIKSTENSGTVICPGLEGYLPVEEKLRKIGIPDYCYTVGYNGLLSFPVIHLEILQGSMRDANLLEATFSKDEFYIQGHLFGTWETDLEDKLLKKRFDLKDLRQAIKFLERVEHAYDFIYETK